MTDMQEMAERIASEKERLNPQPRQAAAFRAETRVFEATIYYSSVYKADAMSRFGIAVEQADVPEDLWGHVRFRESEALGKIVTFIGGRYQPAVIPFGKGDLATILSCTDAANLPRDRLLQGLRTKIAVNPYISRGKMVPLVPTRHHPRGANLYEGDYPTLALTAIQVNVEAMIEAYDKLCAEFFADPSYPWDPNR